jgi:adenylosuccinate synthase
VFERPFKLERFSFCQPLDVKHGPPCGTTTGKTRTAHYFATVLAKTALEIVGAANIRLLAGGRGADAVD